MKFFKKNHSYSRYFPRCIIYIVSILTVTVLANSPNASGVVYEDTNKNQQFDAGEKTIPGVLVSNQREVVKTAENGRYSLPVEDGSVIFVIKPGGYAAPLDGSNLPQFYYIHQPEGSPPLKYAGVPPGGGIAGINRLSAVPRFRFRYFFGAGFRRSPTPLRYGNRLYPG
jgi:hypothetical protein